MNGRVKRMDF